VARAVPEPSHVSLPSVARWARRPSPRVARLVQTSVLARKRSLNGRVDGIYNFGQNLRSAQSHLLNTSYHCESLSTPPDLRFMIVHTGRLRVRAQWHTDSKSSSARVEVSFSPRPRTAHLRSASRNQVRCALQASHTRHDLMYAPGMRPGSTPGPRPGPVHRTLEESGTRGRFSPASCEVGHTG
jgi:hypothetical protein